MARILAPLFVCLMAAAPAQAELKDERAIAEGLITIGIAYEISEVCPAIGARRLRGLNALLALRNQAKALGYSNAQIEAYIDDDVEKDRLEGVARSRLARKGARSGDVQAHCRVGQAEIARGSSVGQLIYNR